MRGNVSPHREALINVEVAGPGDRRILVQAVVDTGFSDDLTLPPGLIRELGLRDRGSTLMVLADGSEVDVFLFGATVVWREREIPILVAEASGPALLGMSFLYGSRLTVDVVDGGDVVIEPLPFSGPRLPQ